MDEKEDIEIAVNAQRKGKLKLELKKHESQTSHNGSDIEKSLCLDSPVWDIVNSFSFRFDGKKDEIVLLPGSKVHYTAFNTLYTHGYNANTIHKTGVKSPYWIKGKLSKGGDLYLEFLDKSQRDQCFETMKRLGQFYREMKVYCFSKEDGPIGLEMDQEFVKRVAPESPAYKMGVRQGWRIVKINSKVVDPKLVVAQLTSLQNETTYKVTFAKPASQEINGFILKEFFKQNINWQEQVLGACILTHNVFTGYFVQKEIASYVSKIEKQALYSGSEVVLNFLSRLCFLCDSLMSRCILSRLDDYKHSDIMNALALQAKEWFFSMKNSESTRVPAICFLLPRLFKLYPSENRKFFPGRAMNVWFRGLSLDFLQVVQSKIDPSWSTEEVKNKFVLEQTISTPTNLMADLATIDQRGPSSVFISHAWRNRYFDLVEACKKYPQDFFFNDILAIQQHKMKSDEMILDLKALPLIIGYASCCLLISDLKLVPLGRIWCLFELYHCLVTTKSKLVVEFTSEGLDAEGDAGLWDVSKDIEERIDSIDVTKSNATVEKDKVRILSEIQDNVSGGIEQFNLQLRAALKEEWNKNIREQWGWKMMQTLGRAVRKVNTLESDVVSLKGTVASLNETVESLVKEIVSLKGKLVTVLAKLDEEERL